MPDVLESGATGAAPEPERSGTDAEALDPEVIDGDPTIRSAAAKRRRRGTRGGRGRNRPRVPGTVPDDADGDLDIDDDQP